MLNSVIFMINDDDIIFPLSQKCIQRGIKVFRQFSKEIDSIIVTDDPVTALNMKNVHPVLFYDQYDKYPFTADYVTDDLDSVDLEYLEMIYCRFYKQPLTIVMTDRTVIREMSEKDLLQLYELYDDGFITKYVEPLYDQDEELEFTRQYIKNMYGFYGYGLWLVFDRETGKLAGRAGLSNRTIDDKEQVELGYVIGREFRNKGYAYEACKAILKYAKEQLKMEEIFICSDKNNLPSLRLAKKLDFNQYGSVIYDRTEYILFNRTIS